MEFILEQVGSFGKFQTCQLMLLSSLSLFSSMSFFATLFTVGNPDFYCTYIDDDTNNIKPSNLSLDTCGIWSNMHNETISSQYKCEFDRKFYGNTFITDMLLICDRKFLASLPQTLYLFGSLFGFLSGLISDKYGRRFCTLLFLFLCSIFMITTEILQIEQIGLDQNARYFIFCFSQFALGLLSRSFYVSAYTILLEITTLRNHTVFSMLFAYGFVSGELTVMSIAYYARDWRIINWTMTITLCILTVLSYIFLTESPTWLIAHKKTSESIQLLKSIAHINDRRINRACYSEVTRLLANDTSNDTVQSTNVLRTCLCPLKNFGKFLVIAYLWVSIFLLFYGVSIGVSLFSAISPYLIFTFHCVNEAIGYALCLLNNRYGRKRPQIFYLITTSAICLVVSFLPNVSNPLITLLIIVLTALGKALSTAALETCFVFTSELYPTEIRGFVLSFLLSAGRVGTIFSPQIILLGELIWKPLPFIIFSASSCIAALFLLTLPDTHTRE